MKNQVFFDASTFMSQKMGGISRYFCEMIKALAATKEIDIIVFGGWSSNVYIESLRDLPNIQLIHRPRKKDAKIGPVRLNSITSKLCSLFQKFHFYKATKKNPNTLYHATFMDIDPFIKKRAKATISTFYDAIPELFHNDGSARSQKYFNKKENCLKASDFVIAISESAERDMLKLYPYLEGITTHIHLASNLPLTKSLPQEPLPKEYLLWVGHRQDYKNGLNTLKAFAKIAPKYNHLHFIFCGGSDFFDEELRVITENNLQEKIVLKKNISDEALALHYKNATALMYTSTYEGFGIPLLEAMQLGCPVVTTKISSLPEVAGEAALYTGEKPDSIAQSICQLMDNTDLKHVLAKKGYEQIKKFTWTKTANETLAVYKKFLSTK